MPSANSWAKLPTNGGAKCIFVLLAIVFLGAFDRTGAAPAVPFSRERILIIPKAGRDAALANQHAAERVKVKKKYPALGNIHILELPPGVDPEKVVERYRRKGDVESADLDYQGWRPAAVPNDPAFLAGTLWHLNNASTGIDIDAVAGWDLLHSASNIIVADVDTGVRVTHEDLASNLWINPGESGGGKEMNGVDDDGDGYIDNVHGINTETANGDLSDDCASFPSHGTHVMGIIGASGNNGVGICGVAWKTKLMQLKFINAMCSGSSSDLIECLDFARARGAKVINCSITSAMSDPMIEAAFFNLQQYDIIVCAAAGNSGSNNDASPVYPASYKLTNLVAVTATWWNDLQYYNYGATSVHLAAPGVEIYSTGSASDTHYRNNSGTSMAAPMVSGAAALLRARFTNESSAQILRRILNSVDVLPQLAGRCVTSGRLNLRRALDTATLPLFRMTNAAHAWVPTNGMTRLNMTMSDSVSGALPLPFALPFYGRSYTQLWVSANGLLGVTNTGLATASNNNIPGTNSPNAIYPHWDDLYPPGGGHVWWGIAGAAPNRKFVATWDAVPHMTGGGGPFTFQAVLHESGQIAFQYQQVELGNSLFWKGRNATIGVEEPSGLFGTRYSFVTASLTNQQAILFTPQPVTHPAPGLSLLSGVAGQIHLTLSGEPAQPAAILYSTNFSAGWSMIYSNVLPASGLALFSETNSSPQKFYRAVSGPFLP